MERPHLIPQIKLEYALPYHEFNVQPDSVQCQEMAKRLKKFYFGYSSLSIETLMVYLMVIGLQFLFWDIPHIFILFVDKISQTGYK